MLMTRLQVPEIGTISAFEGIRPELHQRCDDIVAYVSSKLSFVWQPFSLQDHLAISKPGINLPHESCKKHKPSDAVQLTATRRQPGGWW